MKLLWVAAAVLVACGPGIPSPHEPQTQDLAATFVQAARRGDVSAVRKMFGSSITNGGLWFPDPICELEFAAPGEIGGDRLDELARCLTKVKLSVAPREDSLLDVALLTYDPGIELEARFLDLVQGPWVTWIGFVSRRNLADALPTISPDVLEQLRAAGNREPRVPELDGEVARAEDHFVYAWVKLCIDAEGNVTGVHPREASTEHAGTALVAAIADWKFRPFAPGGRPMPVCSVVLLATPLAAALPKVKIPFPIDSDTFGTVAPGALVRISGETRVAPADDMKAAIQKIGLRRVIGTFKVCIDTAGIVHDVRILRSTGIPSYDGRIVQTMSKWRYEPFVDDGKPAPVCTAVTFVYTQT
jgi:hypothetical protein